MKQELTQIFKNDVFGSVRVVLINSGRQAEDAWFVGKDVAEALGYANTRYALSKLDDDERKDGVAIYDSMGRKQKVVAINESGLYSLIFSSQLESARQFRRWVTSEVLPSIRKHGAYLTPEITAKLKDNPNYITDLISELEETSKHNEQLLHDYNDIRLMKMNTTNEVAEYVEEQLVYSGKGKLRCANLYSNYRTWCGRQHHYTPYSVQQFEELIYYCLVEGHPIIKEGNYYIGIEVKK